MRQQREELSQLTAERQKLLLMQEQLYRLQNTLGQTSQVFFPLILLFFIIFHKPFVRVLIIITVVSRCYYVTTACVCDLFQTLVATLCCLLLARWQSHIDCLFLNHVFVVVVTTYTNQTMFAIFFSYIAASNVRTVLDATGSAGSGLWWKNY